MSITTSEKLELLSHAVAQIEMKCFRGIRFDLRKLSETSINLFVNPFANHKDYPILEIDLKDPIFQEVKSIEDMQKLVFIKLAEIATSISIEKNIDNNISTPLFNIEEISGDTYGHVKDFITELNNQQQYLDRFFKRIMLTLRFQLIKPTYNTEDMDSYTYIKKINPITETLTLSFNLSVMV